MNEANPEVIKAAVTIAEVLDAAIPAECKEDSGEPYLHSSFAVIEGSLTPAIIVRYRFGGEERWVRLVVQDEDGPVMTPKESS